MLLPYRKKSRSQQYKDGCLKYYYYYYYFCIQLTTASQVATNFRYPSYQNNYLKNWKIQTKFWTRSYLKFVTAHILLLLDNTIIIIIVVCSLLLMIEMSMLTTWLRGFQTFLLVTDFISKSISSIKKSHQWFTLLEPPFPLFSCQFYSPLQKLSLSLFATVRMTLTHP